MSRNIEPKLNVKPMSDEELFKAAPSIFADSPIDSVSSQYHFVKTSKILNIFREAGYYPILAGEAKSHSKNGQPYVKHLIQFRSIENLLKVRITEYLNSVSKNT